MSLRAKVSVLVIALAAATALIVAVLAVNVTSRKLIADVDLRLAHIAATPKLLGPLIRDRPLQRATLIDVGTSVEVISKDGSAMPLQGGPEVPVPTEVAAAAEANGPQYFDSEVDSVPYRSLVRRGNGQNLIVVSQDMSTAKSTKASLVRAVAVIGVIVACLAGLLGWLLSGALVRPLRRLTAAAERVDQTGDLSIEVRTESKDESGRLSRAFDSMLGSLAASRDAQRRLVEDAGHELRTPISSISTNAQVLARHRDLDSQTRERIAADLISESRELSALVDSLVDLSTLDDDELPVQLTSAADLVTTASARLPDGAGTRVRVSGDAAAYGRPRQLHRAVLNLLTNAIKFDPGSGAIEVTVTESAGAASIAVRDHGSGIPDADLPHVFDRFHRASSARRTPGSGLGLAIVWDICARNHGSVTVANNADGGVTATLQLPTNPPY